jgi:TRAP-type mannitol/chloroaromatic compound transport system permease small subunit
MTTKKESNLRWLDRLIHWSAGLGAACIAFVCLAMLSMSICREIGINLRGGDDIIAWLCAASAFLMLGQTFKHGGVVRVEILLDQMSPKRRWFFELLSLSLMLIFCVYATYAFGWFVYQSWEMNDLSQGQIIVPLWMPQLPVLLGITVFTLAVFDEWTMVLRKQKPTYRIIQEEKMAAGDFGETA